MKSQEKLVVDNASGLVWPQALPFHFLLWPKTVAGPGRGPRLPNLAGDMGFFFSQLSRPHPMRTLECKGNQKQDSGQEAVVGPAGWGLLHSL